MGKLFNLLVLITLVGSARAGETAATAGPEPLWAGLTASHDRSSAVIVAIVRRHLPGIENAYVAALEREPGLRGGKITVRFAIKAEGSVGYVDVIEDTVGCPPLSASIVERVRAWKFPRVSSVEVAVVYPFIFIDPGGPGEVAEGAAGAAADSDSFREEAEAGREPSPSPGEYTFWETVIESRPERPVAFFVKRRKPAITFDEDELTQFDEETRTFLAEAAAFLDEGTSDPAAALLRERDECYRELREVESQKDLLAVASERAALGTADAVELIPGPAGKETKAAREHRKALEKLEAREKKCRREIERVCGDIDRVWREWASAREGRRDELIREGERLIEREELIVKGELSETYPVNEERPRLVLVLGELYFERSTAAHVVAIREYQEEVAAATAAEKVLKKREPGANYEPTIAACQHIALHYKDFTYADAAHYTLAYCLRAKGEDEEAARTFYKLTQVYPDSPYVAEANFRVGEYFFDQYEFDKAVKYYTFVPPTDPFLGEAALYKRAWSVYNTGDTDDEGRAEYVTAIEEFTSLLDRYGPKALLAREAQDFAAFALYEWAYAATAKPKAEAALALFDEEFRGARERDYSPAILHTLADVYFIKKEWGDAAATYEALLRAYPEYEEKPRALASLAVCYGEDGENYDDAYKARLRLVEDYGPGSSWFEGQAGADRRLRALQRWDDALYEVAVYSHVKGEKKRYIDEEESESYYRRAIDYYNQYLAAFPANPRAYHVDFYLAQAYDAVGDFAEAAVAYEKTALVYDDRERFKIDKWDEKFTRELALFNAVVARADIFDKELGEARAVPETEELPQKKLGRPLTANEAELTRVCGLYVERYPESADAPSVLSKLGEVYFYVDDYERAREAYERIVEDYADAPDPDYQKEHDQIYVYAAENVAKSYFNEAEFNEKADAYKEARRRYELACEWYAKTKRLAISRNVRETIERAASLAALTALKAAEMRGAGVRLEETGEAPPSVTRYDFVEIYPPLRPIKSSAVKAKRAEAKGYKAVAKEYGAACPDVGRLALGKAADTYYEVRDWGNASRVYLDYVSSYPEGEDVKEAYERAAECCERAADWAGAAEVYLAVANHPEFRGTGLGRDCLFRAGMMYEQLEDWAKAAETFELFTEEYPEVAKPRLEATYRLARADEKLGRKSDALEHHREVYAIYEISVEREFDVAGTERFVAESEFKVTDATFDEYEAIKFVMPQEVMEANLQKKIKQSQDLWFGYTDVADLGIPTWSVAGHCRLGDVYYEFAEALRAAEIPTQLLPEYWEALPDDDERKPLLEDAYYEYTSGLEEQSVPLYKKATEEYKEAVAIAGAEGFETTWSRKARERLSGLEAAE